MAGPEKLECGLQRESVSIVAKFLRYIHLVVIASGGNW